LPPPHRIYDDPANIFVAGFVGSPPKNFVAGELSNGRFEAPEASLPPNLMQTRKGVLLGLRPEDCRAVAPAHPTVSAEQSIRSN
jgi:multiple sugar transport system ATP-binding protein